MRTGPKSTFSVINGTRLIEVDSGLRMPWRCVIGYCNEICSSKQLARCFGRSTLAIGENENLRFCQRCPELDFRSRRVDTRCAYGHGCPGCLDWLATRAPPPYDQAGESDSNPVSLL